MFDFAYDLLQYLWINMFSLKVALNIKPRIKLILTLKTFKTKFKYIKRAVKFVK